MTCSRLLVLSALAMLAACPSSQPAPVQYGPPPGPGPAPAPAVQVVDVVDEHGTTFRISQGTPGAPGEVGCADGQREAFVDLATFPTIAGCIAEWQGATNLRAAATNTACGDDAGRCAVAADACAPGWHVCGNSGALADLLRVTPQQCETAGGGRFVAAISHCNSQVGCEYEPAETGNYACYPNGWCSEPVCCGNDCGEFGSCRDGVWPGMTHIPQGTDQGCGSVASSRARGVLCCQ